MLDKLNDMLLYFTLALAAVILLAGVAVSYKNKARLPDFYKYAAGIGIGYALAVGGIFIFLNFYEMGEDGSFNPQFFYPVLGLMLFALLLVVGGLLVSKHKKEWTKPYAWISAGLVGIYILVLILVDPQNGFAGAGYSISEKAWLIISTVLAAGILIAAPLAFGKKTTPESGTTSTVYAAICIALGFALSYIRIFPMPQGGSVTLASLLPLMIYSQMFGVRKGAITGFIYGMLQAIQDPWLLHPLQFLLEYPIAFGLIGLAGLPRDLKLFKGKILPQFIAGGIGVAVLRYLCHAVAGTIVFKEYAAEGFSAAAWGFLYNTFVFADMAIALAAGGLMLSSKALRDLFGRDFRIQEMKSAPPNDGLTAE